MNKTHYISLNNAGEIVKYNLPFVIADREIISNILPIYSDRVTYNSLLDVDINAYDFDYSGTNYIVDVVLIRDSQGFIIYIDDKTEFYRNKIQEQTLENSRKIELEYARLNQSFLASKNNYLEFVISTLSDMLSSALERIDSTIITLEDVNTYVKEDADIISSTSKLIKDEIIFIKQTMSHMSIFKHLDPSTLLDKPEYIPLKKFIIDIAIEMEADENVITNGIEDSVMLYGNREFFSKLLKYYLNNNLLGGNDIEFMCNSDNDNLLGLEIKYFVNIKGFLKPQKFTQNIVLPSSFEIEKDPKLIEEVYKNIKKVLLFQAKILYEVAA